MLVTAAPHPGLQLANHSGIRAGKTELAKALAAHMFASERSLVRLDMSEFMERVPHANRCPSIWQQPVFIQFPPLDFVQRMHTLAVFSYPLVS